MDNSGDLRRMTEGALNANKKGTDGNFRDLSPVISGEDEEREDQADQDRGNARARRVESPTRPRSLRTKVLHFLIEGNEMNTLSMSKKLGVHQSSISHVIKDMIDERLIFRSSHGYRLTNMGRVYTHYMDNFDEMLGSLNRHRDFIIDHEIGGIPANHLAMIGLVLRGRDSMPANTLKPYHKNRFMHDQLKESRRICAVLSTLVPEQLAAALEAAKKGAQIKAILSREVLNSLKKDFIGLFDEALRCKTVEIYVNDDARLSLAITDRNLFLSLHRLDGSYDFDNLIICEDEESMIWGKAVFRHLLKAARRENAFIH
jgi:predicted transcriptional regulator